MADERTGLGRMGVVVLLAISIAGPAAAGGLYAYIDDQGVTHYSDVPRDARFRALAVSRADERSVSIAPLRRVSLPESNGYDTLIVRSARTHRLEPALVKAVVAAESNFDVDAVSRVGAQGLMQLMPATAREMGVRAPFEAWDNLLGGARYLRAMLDRYGDLQRALAAYNAGPMAVDRYGGIPPYRETKAYVERVLNYYRGYQGQLPRYRY